MGTKSSVLRCLINASPDFISGAEIADRLSISRQAVWKAVSSLKEQGHNIESVTKKGYQYKFSDILSAEGIESYLSNIEIPLNILVRDEVDSTNKKLKELPYDEKKPNTVLAVTKQNLGTGRFSRPFFSEGTNGGLYFSILLQPDVLYSDMVNYTLIAAVAVVTALEKLTDISLQIKWVNDIYLDGKKVCGILTEAVSDIESGMITEVIIGIGINVSIPQDCFPEDIRQRVTSLFPDGETNITRNEILATILKEFYQLLNMEKKDILALYSNKSLVLGKRVTFEQNGEEIEGVAKSIGLNGELVVDTPRGSLSLNSGEISLKSF